MSEASEAVLYVNLGDKTSEVKVHTDLDEFVGGLGFVLKLARDPAERGVDDALIIAAGPLAGFFPGCDRAVCWYRDQVSYIDGPFAAELRKSGLDALVLSGFSASPCYLVIEGDSVRFGDSSFFAESLEGEILDWLSENEGDRFSPLVISDLVFRSLGLRAVIVRGDGELTPAPDEEALNSTRERIWRGEIPVVPGGDDNRWSEDWNPPELSSESVLRDCLAANDQTAAIYTPLAVAFSCLDASGHPHTHEELEGLSDKLASVLEEPDEIS